MMGLYATPNSLNQITKWYREEHDLVGHKLRKEGALAILLPVHSTPSLYAVEVHHLSPKQGVTLFFPSHNPPLLTAYSSIPCSLYLCFPRLDRHVLVEGFLNPLMEAERILLWRSLSSKRKVHYLEKAGDTLSPPPSFRPCQLLPEKSTFSQYEGHSLHAYSLDCRIK
ncbi:MAG: hypothetical protein VXZ72_02805 [Chlamydiota bacterium]|nr:hypothetical protein [Chlamydiota bacterium]